MLDVNRSPQPQHVFSGIRSHDSIPSFVMRPFVFHTFLSQRLLRGALWLVQKWFLHPSLRRIDFVIVPHHKLS
jgi:hypothetical protein